MNPGTLGFIRGLGVVILTGVLIYLGDASHLTGVVTPYLAGLISAVALAIENAMAGNAAKQGNPTALFGAVRAK